MPWPSGAFPRGVHADDRATEFGLWSSWRRARGSHGFGRRHHASARAAARAPHRAPAGAVTGAHALASSTSVALAADSRGAPPRRGRGPERSSPLRALDAAARSHAAVGGRAALAAGARARPRLARTSV